MLKTIEDVKENYLCTGCGTCAGVCAFHAITMKETSDGRLIPEINFSICRRCGLCNMVCPQLQVPSLMEEYLKNPYIGPMQKACLCRAVDPAIAFEGQTGGLARSLLAWALGNGEIDGIVCVKDNFSDYFHPEAVLLTTPEEVLTSSRSKYCPVGVNRILSEILAFKGKVAYVGLGCHMQGLALAVEKLPKLREKIVLKIGLFCDRVLTFRAVDYLVWCAGGHSDDISRFDYRHKGWRDWPGDIRIVKKDGRVVNLSRIWRIRAREFFTPLSCRLCVDKLNALADISIGDPHGIQNGKQVSTLVAVRTPAGEKFLLDAYHSRQISLEPLDSVEVMMSQNVAGRVNQALFFGQEMKARHLDVPMFLRAFSFSTFSHRRKFRIRLMVKWTLFTQQLTSRRVASFFFRWIPYFWYYIVDIKQKTLWIPRKGIRFFRKYFEN